MKYWVYMNGEVPGTFTPEELAALPGFSMTTLVCPAEGEILDKNWRRCGEFPDIIPHLRKKEEERRPPAPPPEAPEKVDLDALIDSTETRLFGHVAELIKELGGRREERALLKSLQDRLIEAERDGKARELRLEASLKKSEETADELAQTKRRLTETANELDVRNRLVEKLNAELAQKELGLAKSLAMIQRLEESLKRLASAENR